MLLRNLACLGCHAHTCTLSTVIKHSALRARTLCLGTPVCFVKHRHTVCLQITCDFSHLSFQHAQHALTHLCSVNAPTLHTHARSCCLSTLDWAGVLVPQVTTWRWWFRRVTSRPVTPMAPRRPQGCLPALLSFRVAVAARVAIASVTVNRSSSSSSSCDGRRKGR